MAPHLTSVRGLEGVEQALIYGSWARRYQGEAGPLPQDVDLMVIGDADVAEVRSQADAASRRLGRDVNVTVLTPAEWEHGATGFLTHLKTQPLVSLDLLR
ncbi:MAG: nucleotidyltransferase domain-containing protein [Actinomycetota bacterium]|nr:nucleotidyltransferase domain-containing protein [Actinomycetota bacterium]MDQ2894422.1 nucleotidyltransferase domain-containing protein [Actinomycetota bacterium]